MSYIIGPSFGAELDAAGLGGIGISWNESGLMFGDMFDATNDAIISNVSISVAQREQAQAVLAAHNPATPWPPAPTLDDLKVAQVNAINAAAQKVVDAYTAEYPPFEKLTWATQQSESVAWQAAAAGDRIPTLVPWCATASQQRGVDLAQFMDKVATKVAAFVQASAAIAGKRQGYEDAINAATTVESVTAVVWEP